MLKTLFSLFALSVPLIAGEVKFAWTPSPDDLPGSNFVYLLRAATNTMTTFAPPVVVVNVGTNLTASLIFTNAGRWFVDCIARDTNNVESESSNELIIDVPKPPGQFRTVVLQHAATITNGFSNVGFFRVEIK